MQYFDYLFYDFLKLFPAYGKDHLLSSNAKHVGKVEKHVQEEVSETELWGLRDKKPVPSFLYEINEETLLCICSFNLLPEDISAFSSSVCYFFHPNNDSCFI